MHSCPLIISILPGPDPAWTMRSPPSQNGWAQKNSHLSHRVLKTAVPSMVLSGKLGHPLFSWFLLGVSSSHFLPYHRALVRPSASPCTAPLEEEIDPFPRLMSRVLESFARVTGAYYTLSYLNPGSSWEIA